MTDADQTANTVGDVTITQYGTPKRPPMLLLVVVAWYAAVVGLLVVVVNLGPRTGPASESTAPSPRQKPANDGPGYLVPVSDDLRAADFYQNDWNDSYADGTWLVVSLCSGRDDQKWRIAR
ncbi:hypothetical protein ACFOWZ_22230 [Lentzea rhizosphaerae]|uniref:Ricin B lectin domain-containing protein n=1 Tax=Lentzea rhizosphaerae TaxID=2041025 RepID=A0ABV8BVR3_9PSEU